MLVCVLLDVDLRHQDWPEDFPARLRQDALTYLNTACFCVYNAYECLSIARARSEDTEHCAVVVAENDTKICVWKFSEQDTGRNLVVDTPVLCRNVPIVVEGGSDERRARVCL